MQGLASTSSGARQPVPFVPARPTLDVTAVTLSDVLRLYFEMIDPRPYAICAEAVGDMRRVTVRAPANLTYAALRAILDVHGYDVRTRSGIMIVCGKQQATSEATGTPPASTWGPPSGYPPARRPPADVAPEPVEYHGDGSPVRPARDLATADPPASLDVAQTPPADLCTKVYRPLWRSSGEIMPLIAQAGLGRVVNSTGPAGLPTRFADSGAGRSSGTSVSGGGSGDFLQVKSDYVVWRGTKDEWGQLCTLLDEVDVPTPSLSADVYVFSVSTGRSDADGISVIGRISGVDFNLGQASSNSVGVSLGAASLVLSSIRSRDDVKLVQHYTAQLVNAQEQVLNSGASVPITSSLVDLEGGKTRQATEYRAVGTSVTILPRILERQVQLDMTVELSSVSSLRSGGNVNPTFNQELVRTVVHARPASTSFVSALSTSASAKNRQRFLFIPVSRSDEARATDIVYMIVLHDLDRRDEMARPSACLAKGDPASGPPAPLHGRAGAGSTERPGGAS